jgi:HAD superfamily hydrolase (TIGR01509 family)
MGPPTHSADEKRARRPLRAVCFDLDGTLVDTETLKALSYARAAAEIRPGAVREADVLDAYTAYAGLDRRAIAAGLLERFRLRRAAAALAPAAPPVEVFLAARLRHYEAMLADPSLVREREYGHATALLRRVRAAGLRTGIATMSHATHATRVLEVLGLRGELDAVVTRDEVTAPKPDPEIYLLLAERLGVTPADCLVIEDSLPGVRSALAAGMACVAATTPLTRDAVVAVGVLPPALVVEQPERLESMVLAELAARGVPS